MGYRRRPMRPRGALRAGWAACPCVPERPPTPMITVVEPGCRSAAAAACGSAGAPRAQGRRNGGGGRRWLAPFALVDAERDRRAVGIEHEDGKPAHRLRQVDHGRLGLRGAGQRGDRMTVVERRAHIMQIFRGRARQHGRR